MVSLPYGGVACAGAVPPQVLEQHRDTIYALQFRLSRALAEVREAHKAGRTASLALRRLGPLLRASRSLEEVLLAQAHAWTSTSLSHVPVPIPREEDEEDAAALAYYRARLPEMYRRLRAEAVAAATVLAEACGGSAASPGLPLPCVGRAPTPALTAHEPLCVYGGCEGAAAARQRLPPAALQWVSAPSLANPRRDGSGPRQLAKPSVTSRPPTAVSSTTATTTPAPDPPRTAEEHIVEDIKAAIQQMKVGAMNIHELMSKERPSLAATEALLTAGLAASDANLRDVHRLRDVVDAEGVGGVPRLVRRLPGGPLVWRTVVAPLWAIVRHALLLASVLAVTSTALLVILSLDKPTRFKARRPQGRVSAHGALPIDTDLAQPPPGWAGGAVERGRHGTHEGTDLRPAPTVPAAMERVALPGEQSETGGTAPEPRAVATEEPVGSVSTEEEEGTGALEEWVPAGSPRASPPSRVGLDGLTGEDTPDGVGPAEGAGQGPLERAGDVASPMVSEEPAALSGGRPPPPTHEPCDAGAEDL